MVRPFHWASTPRSAIAHAAVSAVGPPDSAARHDSMADPATLTEPAAAAEPTAVTKPAPFTGPPGPLCNNGSDTVSLGYTRAVIAPSEFGRTRWDVFAEAIQGGWASTTRLAVLLVLRSTPPCGACLLVFRLIQVYLLHRLHKLFWVAR